MATEFIFSKKRGDSFSKWLVYFVMFNMVFSHFFIFSGSFASATGSGSIWTTTGACGEDSQDVNKYSVGDDVYINGENFEATTTYSWDITAVPENKNTPVAFGDYKTDENGDFCFYAYTVQEGDSGEYNATFANKKDNYRVLGPSIGAGDLVINEIMADPGLVSDSDGEWFEIYNHSSNTYDLKKCIVSDNDSDDFEIGESLSIGPGEYLVFGKNADESENGGVEIDYEYEDFLLANVSDEIYIECDDVLIDEVEYNASWPIVAGVSMILQDVSLDNNNEDNWCVSSSEYGGGDLGTPGEENDECSQEPAGECGDGNLDEDEECDDSNNVDGDGCSSSCEITKIDCPYEASDDEVLVSFTSDYLVSNGSPYEEIVTTSVPAGTYNVSLSAFDGYEGRDDDSQANEQYKLVFRDAGGDIAESGETDDLADNVSYAEFSGEVSSELEISSEATKVVARHAYYEDNSSPNSVIPVCALLDPVEEEECTDADKDSYCEEVDCDDNNADIHEGCEDLGCVLKLTKSSEQETVSPGGEIVYNLSLENTGDADCTGGGVILRDVFAENTSYQGSDKTPQTEESEYVEWNFGTMEPGDLEEIAVTVDVSEDAICDSTLTNKAKYWSTETDWSDFVEESVDVVCEDELAYCGDGVVNQEWEECDSDSEDCYACQLDDGCSDITLARVLVDNYSNGSEDADASDRIFLGQGEVSIPDFAWFPIYWEGTAFVDPSVSGYEDVPGLAVERQDGSLRVVLHGSQGTEDVEHVDGVVEFYNASVTNVRSDNSGNNKLEKGFDTIKLLEPGNDEVENLSTSSAYWLTTNTQDDGFFTDWSVQTTEEDCIDRCSNTIDGYKRNALTSETLEGWLIELRNANDDLIATTTTNLNGYYSFSGLCEGEYHVYEEEEFAWKQVSPFEPNYHTVNLVTMETAKTNLDVEPTGLEVMTGYDFSNQPLICGYKYNYYTKEGVSNWDISLKELNDCSEGEQWADEVVSYDNNGTVITDTRRTDPKKALGEAQDADDYNFYSLGLGGELILKFNNVIINGDGDDIKVYETTFNNSSCAQYPEYIEVYASQDNETWFPTIGGPDCQEGESYFDLDSLEWAQYIKIVDLTDMPNGDGYDVDGVEALHCGSWELAQETVTDDSGLYCFETGIGTYMIFEGEREGWEPYTNPYSPMFQFLGEEPYLFDFENTPPMPSLEVCKYNESDSPLTGWNMEVYGTENLVRNGDFEYPTVLDNDGKWQLFNGTETDWTISWIEQTLVSDPVVELQTVMLWDPFTGSQYAELDSHDASKKASVSLEQEIPTTPGNKYKLSFAFSSRPGIVDNSLGVEFGSFSMTYDKDGSGNSQTDWQNYEYIVTADSATTTLRFSDYSQSDSLGTFLDSVSVYEMLREGETGEGGCVVFEDMDYGDYMIYEDNKLNWYKQYPETDYHSVSLVEGDSNKMVYFVNSYDGPPTPLSGLLNVCQMEDEDGMLPATGTPELSEEWVFSVNGQTATTTPEDSCVSFELPAGEHTLTRNVLPGWYDLSPSTASTTVVIGAGFGLDVEFYSTKYSGLGGYVYLDDGSTTTPMAEAEVLLFMIGDPNQQIASTTSASDGKYWFDNLLPGSYYVETQAPTGTAATVSPSNPIVVISGSVLDNNNFVFGSPVVQDPICGDGVIDTSIGETCDDSNTISGDGCSSSCIIENSGGGSYRGSGSRTAAPTLISFGPPSLYIEISVNKDPVAPGDTLEYTIVVTNNGLGTAEGAVVNNVLPDGLIFKDNGDKSRDFNLGDLAYGGIWSVSYDALVADDFDGQELVNVARASAQNTSNSVEDSVAVGVEETPVVLGVEYTLPETGFRFAELVYLFLALLLVSTTRKYLKSL